MCRSEDRVLGMEQRMVLAVIVHLLRDEQREVMSLVRNRTYSLQKHEYQ